MRKLQEYRSGCSEELYGSELMAIILSDVDHVALHLDFEWYKRYNEDYDDCLKPEHVTEWAIHKFVKPSCGKKIYDYLLMPDLYDNVPLVAGAMDGIMELRNAGHQVVFVSSGIHRGKYLRLKEFNLVQSEDDYYCAHNKSLIHGDYLLDDGMHNVTNWKWGTAILFDAPHNRHEEWYPRAENWEQAVDIILNLEERKVLSRRMYVKE
jgi:5'-nucleotidase